MTQKLRLIHDGLATTPQNLNSILLADLDLENAEKAGERTHGGHPVKRNAANKQAAYVPVSNPFDAAQPGFIDLFITDRVQRSYEVGEISKALAAGWITHTFFDDATLSEPAISAVALSAAINGTLSIDGSGLTSISPDIAALLIRTPTLPPIELQFTRDEILAAPYSGTWTATDIDFVVPVTSSLGQILRDPATLLISVYSDGVISDEFTFNWVP